MNTVRVLKLLRSGTADDIAYIEVETESGVQRLEFTGDALSTLPATAVTALGLFHQKHGTGMPSLRAQSVAFAVSEPEQNPLLVVHPALAKYPFLFSLEKDDLGPLADAIQQFRNGKG